MFKRMFEVFGGDKGEATDVSTNPNVTEGDKLTMEQIKKTNETLKKIAEIKGEEYFEQTDIVVPEGGIKSSLENEVPEGIDRDADNISREPAN